MNRPLCWVAAASFVWLCCLPGGAASARVISWRYPIPIIDRLYAERLDVNERAIALEEHAGPMHGKATSAKRSSLAFSALGCVVDARKVIRIYPATRWGVLTTDLRTGKASKSSEIELAFPTAAQATGVLKALEDANPTVRKKVGICKSDTDLYHLEFGAIPAESNPFSWVRNSIAGATGYALWVHGASVYVKESDSILPVYYYKIPVAEIGCVRVEPETTDLASSISLVPTLPKDVLVQRMEKRAPRVFTESSVMLVFDNETVQQDALQYLEDKSPRLSKKLNAC